MTNRLVAAQLLAHCQADLVPTTRLTPLMLGGQQVWVKREDDLWLGGNKLRKAASLIRHLQQKDIAQVALIGGAYSNHVLALAQLMPQYGIQVQAFLRGEAGLKPVGNQQMLQLLLPEAQRTWVPRKAWASVEDMAANWAAARGAAVIPEGGFHRGAVAGAATLALDIAQHESNTPQRFTHLWMDAGTGLTAAACLLTDALLCAHRHYHVVLLADDAATFQHKLEQVQHWLQELLGLAVPIPPTVTLHTPPWAPQFGKVTATVLRYAQDFARQYGIVVDPVYTAKLFATAEDWLGKQASAVAPTLIVHSGGQLALMGFAPVAPPQED